MKKNHRKTICFLPNRLMLGGIEKVLIDALKILHNKYDIEIILFVDDQHPAILNEIPSNVKVIFKQLPKNKFLRYISHIPFLSYLYFDRAIGKKYDFLITLRPSLSLTGFSKKAKHKIFWLHSDFNNIYKKNKSPIKNIKSNKYLKTIYKHYDMIWTVCDTIKTDIEERLKLKNVYTLPNPINCMEIYEKSAKDCDLVFDETKTNIVMIGRLSQEKGFMRVIKILVKNIFKEYPNTHLYIIGDGAIPAYQKFINKFNYNNKIDLLGPKDNPFPYLKQAQLFICPSYHESFGLALIEAMLLKIPIITTDTVGGKYLTQNNKLAYCVKNDDLSIQNAIEEFLNDTKNYPYSVNTTQQWAEKHDLKFFEKNILDLLSKFEKD